MNQRLTWTLCAVIGACVLGTAQGQAPDCEPATRACFDSRADLPIAAEPSAREGYERPTVKRYIVALAEAHDSGLSADDMLTFSGDPFNLTVAMPYENRTVKSDRDAADYLSKHNQCWFAGRVITVKQKWGLSVDGREAQSLETTLADCTPEQIAASGLYDPLRLHPHASGVHKTIIQPSRPSTGRRALAVALAEIGRRKLPILESFGVTIVKLRLTGARDRGRAWSKRAAPEGERQSYWKSRKSRKRMRERVGRSGTKVRKTEAIYLDANATVRPLDLVVEAVNGAMREAWGNPSSEHTNGIAARRVLMRARDAAAALLPGIEPEDVVLTSGGTEASNTILATAGRDSTLIVSAVEHPATMRPAELARRRGANLIVVPVDAQGQVDPDAFAKAAVQAATRSVYASVQWANGETGVIQAVAAISAAISAVRPDAIIHLDAAQAVGRIRTPVPREVTGCSFSGHKLPRPARNRGLGAQQRRGCEHRGAHRRWRGKSEACDPGRRTSLARPVSEQHWRPGRQASKKPSSECARYEMRSRLEFSRLYRRR